MSLATNLVVYLESEEEDDDIEFVGHHEVGSTTANASQEEDLDLESDNETPNVSLPENRTKRTAETSYLEEYEKEQEKKKKAKRAERDAKINAMRYETPMEVAAHLKDDDDEVRWAAEELIKMGGPGGAQALVASFDNFSTWERARAIELLGDMGADALHYAGPIAAWPCARAIASRLNDSDLVREAAADALGKLGPAGAAHAHALFARLDDEDEIEDVVQAASGALHRLGFQQYFPQYNEQ